MYRLRFYPIPLALVCCLWLTSFSGCGVVQECITGKDCPVKYICQNGTCIAQADPCAATGGTSCGSACVDLRTNNDHCGACATKCGIGSTCQNGQCKAVTKPCQSNAECPTGQVCQNGQCKAVTQPVCTFGQDQTCNHRLEMSALAGTCLKDGTCQCNTNFVKNQSSGKCDIACKASTEICNGLDDDCDGVIDNNCTCPSGQTRCGSICVDLQTNNDHCGACGQKCGIGTGCKAGSCKPVVPPPCASNADCAAGQVCSNGQCQPHITPCASDADCAAGQVCQNGQCQPHTTPCTSNANCAAGQVCQNGQCK
ncbi:hypothetical protein L6R29_24175 [Myxococcota bacterium]|nr:hypothetical protein [Myxococcota bacterium]